MVLRFSRWRVAPWRWLAGLLLALPLLAVAWVALFGWNWARAPLQQLVGNATGRALRIDGDLTVALGWHLPRIHAKAVAFANPAWATHAQMLTADQVEFTVDLRALLGRKLVLPEVHLTHPVVFLELAPDGRKTWLLDLGQADERTRVPIGRLVLDAGEIGYDDPAQKTSIQAQLATQPSLGDGTGAPGVAFRATGRYKGLALTAHGTGGPVLALQDENTPYPLTAEARFDQTVIQVDGTITSLLKLSAIDAQLNLQGDNLALLFPLLRIALPRTHPYVLTGHLAHSGTEWQYGHLAGRIGKSDITGKLQIDTGTPRPTMRGDLVSQMLDFADLAPVVGLKEPEGKAPRVRVLPDIPFNYDRWNSVDADVVLQVKTIARPKELPLENLKTHIRLQNAVLTLDPLDFSVAGGQLQTAITLDGTHNPIQAQASVVLRKIMLAKLFPTVKVAAISLGQVNGTARLAGKGNSVGQMLASADGRVTLTMANGEVSKLFLEKLGLHLLEILQLQIIGDRAVKVRCMVADFAVQGGVMRTSTLLLDSEVTTVTGSGTVDLARERLDLTLVPKTRNTSMIALRSPIRIGGSFAAPQVAIDKAGILARTAGAVALAMVNPLLVIIPLVEMGPGEASRCAAVSRH